MKRTSGKVVNEEMKIKSLTDTRLTSLDLNGKTIEYKRVGAKPPVDKMKPDDKSKPRNLSEEEKLDALKDLALCLVGYSDANGRGPSRLEDLKGLVDDESYQLIASQIGTGEVIVAWGVSSSALVKSGTGDHVVAYYKDVPTKGGYIVLADQSTKKG